MEVKKIFVSNYLSHKKYAFAETYALLFLALCVLFSLAYWENYFNLHHLLAANADKVFNKGEHWRLLSSQFVHGDLKHLLSNSLMLFILFYFNASFYGGIFTLINSCLFGMLTFALTLSQYNFSTNLVGASGVVFYLWGFWLVLYLFIQTQYSFIVRLIRIIGIFLILLVPTSLDPQTSYMAHYIGFSLGVIVGFVFYFYKRKAIAKEEKWKYEYIPDDLEKDVEEFNYYQ